MHTSEGLELESETSPAGRFWFLYWRPAQLQVRPANRAGRDLLWHPQDIARAMPSLLRSPPQYKRVPRMYGFRHLNITISKESREGNH